MKDAAVQAADLHVPPPTPAEEVCDTFCPDTDYLKAAKAQTQTPTYPNLIPQLDGCEGSVQNSEAAGQNHWYDTVYNVAAPETRAIMESCSEISLPGQCSAPSSAVFKPSRGHVRDAIVPDNHIHYLLEQKRVREAEIKKLEENFSLGFKPRNLKKPF